MPQPLVSIALCTYNGEKYLAEQLNSVLAQTYKNLEIVIVDDASTDDTFLILQEYADKHECIKLFRNNSNLGFTKNFEKAIKLCQGIFIALCDQDDIWHPNKIALQVAAMDEEVMVYHDSEFVQENGQPMNKKMSDVVNLYSGDQPEVFLFFNCVSGHSIMMRKVLAEVALPLPAGYFHDWWIAYVATNMGSIKALPQSLVKYRQHSKSDTNILRLQRDNDKYKFTSAEKLERNKKWLKMCLDFPHNKNPELISSIYHAYLARINSYVDTKLARLLVRYRKSIFYIQKKSGVSKLNYIYKQIWGAKLKTLFK